MTGHDSLLEWDEAGIILPLPVSVAVPVVEAAVKEGLSKGGQYNAAGWSGHDRAPCSHG
jgi:hypothetical protein